MDLTPKQAAVLQRILSLGFELIAFPVYEFEEGTARRFSSRSFQTHFDFSPSLPTSSKETSALESPSTATITSSGKSKGSRPRLPAEPNSPRSPTIYQTHFYLSISKSASSPLI